MRGRDTSTSMKSSEMRIGKQRNRILNGAMGYALAIGVQAVGD